MGKLALSAGYIAPLLLVAWIWLSNRFQLRFRVLALLALPVLYGAQWLGVEALEGWPAKNPMPASFEILSADIREPDKLKDDPGGIFLWVRESDDVRPRAYQLAYDRKLHEELHAARQRMKNGTRQMGSAQGRETAGNGPGAGSGQVLQIEDAPPISLPPKF